MERQQHMTMGRYCLVAWLSCVALCVVGCDGEQGGKARIVCEEACISLAVCNLGFERDEAQVNCADPSFASSELRDCQDNWEDCQSADREAISECINFHNNTCQDQTLFSCLDAIACTAD